MVRRRLPSTSQRACWLSLRTSTALLSDSKVRAHADAFPRYCGSLQRAGIGDNGAGFLSAVLRADSALRILKYARSAMANKRCPRSCSHPHSLADNGITRHGTASLSSALCSNSRLEELMYVPAPRRGQRLVACCAHVTPRTASTRIRWATAAQKGLQWHCTPIPRCVC